jgi:hypothetical protein
MASLGDYKLLITKWLNRNHTVGSPDLDALIDISENTGIPKDYFIELVLGNIPGATGIGRVSFNGTVTDAQYSPIWGGSSPMVFPVAAETWELVSNSASDTLAGTGARVVVVNYLDFDYIEQTATVNMDGVSGAQVAIDCYRPVNMAVVSSGATKWNEGEITLQVAGGGNPRGFIKATIGNSQDTYTSVPAGKRLILVKLSPYLGKDDSGNLKGLIEFNGTNTTLTSGVFPVYQNTFDVGFEVPFIAPEKTDFWWEFKSNSPEPIVVNLVTEFILKDND